MRPRAGRPGSHATPRVQGPGLLNLRKLAALLRAADADPQATALEWGAALLNALTFPLEHAFEAWLCARGSVSAEPNASEDAPSAAAPAPRASDAAPAHPSRARLPRCGRRRRARLKRGPARAVVQRARHARRRARVAHLRCGAQADPRQPARRFASLLPSRHRSMSSSSRLFGAVGRRGALAARRRVCRARAWPPRALSGRGRPRPRAPGRIARASSSYYGELLLLRRACRPRARAMATLGDFLLLRLVCAACRGRVGGRGRLSPRCSRAPRTPSSRATLGPFTCRGNGCWKKHNCS
jgi:hypothetical protein